MIHCVLEKERYAPVRTPELAGLVVEIKIGYGGNG